MGIYRGTGGTGDSTTDTTVTTVTEKAAEAASSATSAANSATSAANSASSASTSETNAATSESNAATSASNASTSETNAATSASQAATSATNSASSATASASSASSASTSATNAATSATAAQTAETNAETAETNAETAYANTLAIFGDATDVQNAVDDAEKLAINPEDSQYTLSDAVTTGYSALHYAAKAEDYKTAAEVSKNAAETAETAAETAQGLAETAKTAAETAQSAAETAQAAAELAQSNAETVYDNFDDRYLGNKSGDPLVDNDNDGLTTGTLYFNTTENEMRVYTGTAWEPVQELSGDQTVNSLTSNNDVVVKGNLEVQGTTITVDSATAQTIDLGDNDKIRLGDTDDLQIYHDGTDSYIANTTGTLKLSGNTDVTGNITVSGTVDGRDVATDGSKLDGIEASADVTDTANVTAAGALMDSEVTNLAQVKAFDSADYATAAQGTTADNALPTAGGTMTGDLAFGDNVKAKFGAGNDLKIYHDGTKSYIDDTGTGEILMRTNRFIIKNVDGTETIARFDQNSYGKLYYDDSQRLETTSSGVDITGTVVADGLTVDGDGSTFNSINANAVVLQRDGGSDLNTVIHFNQTTADSYFGTDSNNSIVIGRSLNLGISRRAKFDQNGDIFFYEDTGTTAKLTWDASAEELQFKDNVKAEFGDGGDLTIEHNGSASTINNYTSTLQINQFANDSDVVINSDDGSGSTANYFRADGSTGEAILYHYGSQKLATKSTGIDVTGTVTADGLTVDGSANAVTLQSSSQNVRYKITDGTVEGRLGVDGGVDVYSGSVSAHPYRLRSNDTKRIEIASNGDISFYDDAGTSQDFYWDASTSRLGLGTTSPAVSLDVRGDGTFYSGASTTFTVGNGLSSGESSTFDLKASYNGNRIINFKRATTIESRILSDSSEHLNIDFNRSATADFRIRRGSGSVKVSEFYSTGDIAFFDDTGASKDFYWDASTSRLGIGTTSPSGTLTIDSTGSAQSVITTSTDGSSYVSLDIGGFVGTPSVPREVAFFTNVFGEARTERMRIDSSGNVGIGTTSPLTPLHIASADGAGIRIDRTGNSAYMHLYPAYSSVPTLMGKGAGGLHLGYDSNTAGIRIDTNNNVGIDNTSPGDKLDISTGNINLSNDWGLVWGGGTGRPFISGNKTSQALRFGTNGSERMRIDSSGNVGIGTTSVNNANKLHARIASASLPSTSNQSVGLFENSSNAWVTIGAGNTSYAGILFADSGDSDVGQVRYYHNDNSLQFLTNASEAARITSFGNLLVGKTAEDSTVQGCEARVSGQLFATSDGAQSIFLNRKTSDGTIAEFRKDGSTVGSIGTYNDQVYIGRDDTGIRFTSGDDALLPVNANSGAVRSGSIDLGRSYSTFRNLYLSGGVYLGGTGADNLLDDYEEGTFTADIKDSNDNLAKITVGTGKYTKVGNVVTVTVNAYVNSVSQTFTGYPYIDFPFGVANGRDAQCSVAYLQGVGTAETLFVASDERIKFATDTVNPLGNVATGVTFSGNLRCYFQATLIVT